MKKKGEGDKKTKQKTVIYFCNLGQALSISKENKFFLRDQSNTILLFFLLFVTKENLQKLNKKIQLYM